MNNALSRMRKLLKKFNKHSYSIEDVYKIAKRERINIRFYKMLDGVRGYYQTERKRVYRKKYICLSEKLNQAEILEVLLHEIVHHFLHVSGNKQQTFFCRVAHLNDSKNDLEADAISLILEVPQAKLLELYETNFENITEFSQEKLLRRWRVYNDHGE